MAHGPVLTRPEHVRRQKWSRAELPSISAAPQDNNKFVWNVTIMGDLDGGWYENGIYHLTLSFSPDFPEVHPRPRFATKMFHPQINEDGFPYLSVSMADSKVSALSRALPPSPPPPSLFTARSVPWHVNVGTVVYRSELCPRWPCAACRLRFGLCLLLC